MLYAQSKGLTPSHARTHESGIAITQLVVVLAAVTIVCVLAITWLKTGNSSLQLSNSAQQFAEHVERARADSIRRRAVSGEEASVEVLSATTYRLKMGFGGSSTLTTRDFRLEGDTVFTTYPTIVSFDGRGRLTSGSEASFALRNSSGSTTVDVTGSGDVTVNILRTELDIQAPHLVQNTRHLANSSPDLLINSNRQTTQLSRVFLLSGRLSPFTSSKGKV